MKPDPRSVIREAILELKAFGLHVAPTDDPLEFAQHVVTAARSASQVRQQAAAHAKPKPNQDDYHDPSRAHVLSTAAADDGKQLGAKSRAKSDRKALKELARSNAKAVSRGAE